MELLEYGIWKLIRLSPLNVMNHLDILIPYRVSKLFIIMALNILSADRMMAQSLCGKSQKRKWPLKAQAFPQLSSLL